MVLVFGFGLGLHFFIVRGNAFFLHRSRQVGINFWRLINARIVRNGGFPFKSCSGRRREKLLQFLQPFLAKSLVAAYGGKIDKFGTNVVALENREEPLASRLACRQRNGMRTVRIPCVFVPKASELDGHRVAAVTTMYLDCTKHSAVGFTKLHSLWLC